MSDVDIDENRLATQAETTAMLGPILVGDLVAIMLYGVLLTVFTNFLRTKTWGQSGYVLRLTIALVVALTSVTTALCAIDNWQFGTYAPAADTDWLSESSITWALQPLFLVVIALIVQSTLVVRASRIIQAVRWRTVYFIALGLLIIVETFAGACATMYEIRFALIPDEDYTMGVLGWTTSIIVWHWFAAAVDILISAIYIYNLLHRVGNVAETVGAETVTRIIISLVVKSAAYTAVLAVVAASVITAFPDWNLLTVDIYYAFRIPLPALYALSLFTTLSIRERVTAELIHQHETRMRSLSGSGEAHTSSSSRRKWCSKNKSRFKTTSKGTRSSGRAGWHLSLCAGAPSSPIEGVRVERQVVVSQSEAIGDEADASTGSLEGVTKQLCRVGDEEKMLGIEGWQKPRRTGGESGPIWCASWHDPDEDLAQGEHVTETVPGHRPRRARMDKLL